MFLQLVSNLFECLVLFVSFWLYLIISIFALSSFHPKNGTSLDRGRTCANTSNCNLRAYCIDGNPNPICASLGVPRDTINKTPPQCIMYLHQTLRIQRFHPFHPPQTLFGKPIQSSGTFLTSQGTPVLSKCPAQGAFAGGGGGNTYLCTPPNPP